MIISKNKNIKNRKFSYQPRYYTENENEEKTISFREGGVFDQSKVHLAGKLRGSSAHIKRPRNSAAARTVRFAILMALFAVVYFIYTDQINVYIGFSALMILLVVFINKSKRS